MNPRLDHFIVRPQADDGTAGAIVPLVAVDQLPDWMQLAGVPRELDAEQTIGMTNLGVVDNEDDSTFEVRLHHDKIRAILNDADDGGGKTKAKATKKKTIPPTETRGKANVIAHAASDESLSTSTGTSSSTTTGPVEKPKLGAHHRAERTLSASRHNPANAAPDTTHARSISEKPLRPHMTAAARDGPRPPAPQRATRQDRQPTTVFCRHWCHHGTCKWGLDCRYQHRMPVTRDGLQEVGLRDFPAWYLLATGAGLPGLPGMGAGLSGPGGAQSPAQQKRRPQPLTQLHHVPDQPPSLLDLDLVQDRVAALLAPGGAVSNRKKLKQIREMRHLLLRGAHAQDLQQQQQQQPARPHNNKGGGSSNYANLYTNASVAANAASIRQQAERQKEVRDDMPVATRARAKASVGDDGGNLAARRVGSGSNGGNYAPGVRGNGIPGIDSGRAGAGEEKLVDID